MPDILSLLQLNKYSHLEDGGWWCNAGVDPRSFSASQRSQAAMNLKSNFKLLTTGTLVFSQFVN
ncbi:MAG: hypothetical protein ICV54_13440 [Nostoc sp. C3-bin3]|nr:hypothetical protein [Nostoc sp. C3-bin3]